MEEEASLTITHSNFSQMLEVTTVGYHEDVYMDVGNSKVRMLAGAPGASAGTYTDFSGSMLEDIDGKAHAYFNSGEVLSYLDLVSNGSSTEIVLTFYGTGDFLSSRMTISPAHAVDEFEVSLVLPSGDSVMDSIPTQLPKRFDAEDRFVVPVDDDELRPLSTKIETTIESLDKIVKAVGLREELNYYPIVVEGGEFKLDVGSESSEKIDAILEGSVEGEDLTNIYGGHFKETVSKLSGGVTLYCDSGGPLEILQQGENMVIRHLYGNAR